MKTYYDTSDIQREALGHFFSKDAMRFFKSKVLETVYQGPGGVFFVTSEKCPHQDKRMYTVRQYHTDTRQVGTYGEFNKSTRAQAIKIAKYAASQPLDIENYVKGQAKEENYNVNS